jgi:hypothetical protein
LAVVVSLVVPKPAAAQRLSAMRWSAQRRWAAARALSV